MTKESDAMKGNKRKLLAKLPVLHDPEARAKEIHELIARRAYALYEGRGHMDGRHNNEDWAQAEAEVLATLPVGLQELNDDLTVGVGVTPAELPELQVRIEPWRLVVSGKRKTHGGEVACIHPGEGKSPVEIFQVVEFPAQVEPSGAKAVFANGLLEFPKARKTEKSVAATAA